jgi:hypothetical protein
MRINVVSDKLRPGSMLRAALRRFGRAREGMAAVEFTVVAPVLMFILVGMADVGTGLYRKMQVQSAAQAGGHYATLNGFDESSITSAVSAGTSLAVTAQPAPAKFCGCPTSAGITELDCSLTCIDGSTPGTYVRISAQSSYGSWLSYPNPADGWKMNNKFVLTAQSVVRIQ